MSEQEIQIQITGNNASALNADSSYTNPDLNLAQFVYPEDERVDGILDLRQISIVNALPVWKAKKEVLVVGSGDCKIDNYLVNEGYTVYSTDMPDGPGHGDSGREKYKDNINYTNADIFDLKTFPVEKCETVICSEVLEHIPDWQTALNNLVKLTKKRLIITIPHHRSYDVVEPPPRGHCNYWTDNGDDCFESLAEKEDIKFHPIWSFTSFLFPLHVSISKIVTKPEDIFYSARDYLIIIDKLQVSDSMLKIQDADRAWWPELYDGDSYRVRGTQRLGRGTEGYPPTKCGPPLPSQTQSTVVVVHNFKTFEDKHAAIDPGRNFLNNLETEINLFHCKIQPVHVSILDEINNSTFADSLKNHASFKGGVVGVLCIGDLLTEDALISCENSIRRIYCDFNSKSIESSGNKISLYDNVFDLSKTSWNEIGKKI
jgi:hypothetical protein